MTKYYSLLLIFFFYSAIVTANQKAHSVHLPGSDVRLKKAGAIKVLSGVNHNVPKIYADSAGNAIVFAVTHGKKNFSHTQAKIKIGNNSKKQTSASTNQKSSLAYSVFVASKKKWSAQQHIKLPDNRGANRIIDYQLINAQSNANNILLVTNKRQTQTKAGKKVAASLTVDQSLWSLTKQSLIGQWGKPQLLLRSKGPLPVIQRDCNKRACVIAWQKRTESTKTNKQGKHKPLATAIHLKSRILDQPTSAWTDLEVVYLPHNQQLLQLKVLMLDRRNMALVWVAATKSANKVANNGNHPLSLKIFVRMRLNSQWQKAVAVATLGDFGRVNGLGDVVAAADPSGKIILSWAEKRQTAELRSVVFDQQWSTASTVYRDSPEVTALSAHFSKQGRATLIWQQKYGINTHIFYSELNAITNRWTAPLKLDQSPRTAILKSIIRNASDQRVAVWRKNFSRVQLAYIDKRTKLVRSLNNIGQQPSVFDVALLENQIVKFCWLRATPSLYEVWVQQAELKTLEGKR